MRHPGRADHKAAIVADGEVAVAVALAEVVKPIRQRRALGMANEIKATSSV